MSVLSWMNRYGKEQNVGKYLLGWMLSVPAIAMAVTYFFTR